MYIALQGMVLSLSMSDQPSVDVFYGNRTSRNASYAVQSTIAASTANSWGDRFPKALCCLSKSYCLPQNSTFSSASARDRKQLWFGHTCRNRPLKASMKALSVGLPVG